jgi:hypothetical protein
MNREKNRNDITAELAQLDCDHGGQTFVLGKGVDSEASFCL